jgi:hypothetical protein
MMVFFFSLSHLGSKRNSEARIICETSGINWWLHRSPVGVGRGPRFVFFFLTGGGLRSNCMLTGKGNRNKAPEPWKKFATDTRLLT